MSEPKVEPLSAEEINNLRSVHSGAFGYCRFCGMVPWPCAPARLLATLDAKEGELQEMYEEFGRQNTTLAELQIVEMNLREENTRLERELGLAHKIALNEQGRADLRQQQAADEITRLERELAETQKSLREWFELGEELLKDSPTGTTPTEVLSKLRRECITAESALEWEKSTHAVFVAVHHATCEKLVQEKADAAARASRVAVAAMDVEHLFQDSAHECRSLRADLAKAQERLVEATAPGTIGAFAARDQALADLAKAREDKEDLRDELYAELGTKKREVIELTRQLAEQSRTLAAGDEKIAVFVEKLKGSQYEMNPVWQHACDYAYQYAANKIRQMRALRPEAKGAALASTKTADQLLDDAEFFLRPRADVKLTESESHYRQLWREELGFYRAGQVDREAGIAGAMVHVPGPVRDEECSAGIPEADTVGAREGRVWQPAPEPKAPLDPTLMHVAADVLESHLLSQPAPETCKVRVGTCSAGCNIDGHDHLNDHALLCGNPPPPPPARFRGIRTRLRQC